MRTNHSCPRVQWTTQYSHAVVFSATAIAGAPTVHGSMLGDRSGVQGIKAQSVQYSKDRRGYRRRRSPHYLDFQSSSTEHNTRLAPQRPWQLVRGSVSLEPSLSRAVLSERGVTSKDVVEWMSCSIWWSLLAN